MALAPVAKRWTATRAQAFSQTTSSLCASFFSSAWSWRSRCFSLGPTFYLQHGRPILEQLLLPSVEETRGQSLLVAHIGNRSALQQVFSQNRELLLRCEMSSFSRHLDPPGASYSCYHRAPFCPVPAESIDADRHIRPRRTFLNAGFERAARPQSTTIQRANASSARKSGVASARRSCRCLDSEAGGPRCRGTLAAGTPGCLQAHDQVSQSRALRLDRQPPVLDPQRRRDLPRWQW